MGKNKTMLHRHDISDKLWEKLKDRIPGSEGKPGRKGSDNRKFLNAVFWIIRTGAPLSHYEKYSRIEQEG